MADVDCDQFESKFVEKVLKKLQLWNKIAHLFQQAWNLAELTFSGQLWWVDLIKWVSNVRSSVRP